MCKTPDMKVKKMLREEPACAQKCENIFTLRKWLFLLSFVCQPRFPEAAPGAARRIAGQGGSIAGRPCSAKPWHATSRRSVEAAPCSPRRLEPPAGCGFRDPGSGAWPAELRRPTDLTRSQTPETPRQSACS